MRARDAYALGIGGSVLVAAILAFLGPIFVGLSTHDVTDRAAAARDASRALRLVALVLGVALFGLASFVVAYALSERRPRTASRWGAAGFAVLAALVLLLTGLHATTGWP